MRRSRAERQSSWTLAASALLDGLRAALDGRRRRAERAEEPAPWPEPPWPTHELYDGTEVEFPWEQASVYIRDMSGRATEEFTGGWACDIDLEVDGSTTLRAECYLGAATANWFLWLFLPQRTGMPMLAMVPDPELRQRVGPTVPLPIEVIDERLVQLLDQLWHAVNGLPNEFFDADDMVPPEDHELNGFPETYEHCPDGMGCRDGGCFRNRGCYRVHNLPPLPFHYPDDEWPEEIRRAHHVDEPDLDIQAGGPAITVDMALALIERDIARRGHRPYGVQVRMNEQAEWMPLPVTDETEIRVAPGRNFKASHVIKLLQTCSRLDFNRTLVTLAALEIADHGDQDTADELLSHARMAWGQSTERDDDIQRRVLEALQAITTAF